VFYREGVPAQAGRLALRARLGPPVNVKYLLSLSAQDVMKYISDGKSRFGFDIVCSLTMNTELSAM
jgi:hypothetical protein